MDDAARWYFSKEELANTPSRKHGISESKELSFRQQAANFIQDMGQRLQVNQLCINTAIVYMHRFYVFHSFTEIHRNKLSLSALFLAAKVEEQPRKLEHLIKVAHACLHKDQPALDVRSEAYQDKMFEVVAHENILLQTLGFVLGIEHPHTYVVKVCQLVKASKELAQTSYIMATTSLHMTTMCLMYKPNLVACVCIQLACKWSDWRIDKCSEGKDWFFYVDKNVTLEMLDALTNKFIYIMETSPHRFRKRCGAQKDNASVPRSLEEPSTSKAGTSSEVKQESSPGLSGLPYDFSEFDSKPLFKEKSPVRHKPPAIVQPPVKSSTPVQPSPMSNFVASPQLQAHHKKSTKPVETKPEPSHSISLDAYREKREKIRLQAKVPSLSQPPPPMDSPTVQPQVIKKPQHAFHEAERVPHRTSSKHSELPPVSIKEKTKIPESKKEPSDHSTSLNKPNHLAEKVNSNGSHHKVRHNTFIPKADKKELIPEERELPEEKIFPAKVDSYRQEKIELIPIEKHYESFHKQEKIDHIKPEKIDHVRPEKIDHIKPEKIEHIKPEKIEHIKPEKIEHIKPEKIDNLKIDMKHEKIELKKDKTELVKQEKVEVKTEVSNMLPAVETFNIAPRPVIKEEAPIQLDNVVKKERREKHKKHSSHSKERSVSNHLEHAPLAGIKVKIPKTVINLSGKIPESSQKYSSSKPDSPKRSLKIKIPKPPERPPESTRLKLVITKDKSGTGSWNSLTPNTQKNDREKDSKKRVHSNSVSDGNGKNVYDMPPAKHQKVEHSQRSHHSNASGGSKPSKSSRHSSHRSGMEHSMNDGVPQYPANGNNAYGGINAQSYPPGYMYNFPPPPQPPKMKAYNMPTGKTNSNPPLPPPLPPPPPPPPE